MVRLSLLLVFLLGCARAVHPTHILRSGSVYEGKIRVEAPPHWELVRNRRFLGRHVVAWKSPDSCCVIEIKLEREGRRARALPLSLVAELYPIMLGHHEGIETEIVDTRQIDLSGREAWAVTVKRRHGPHEQLMSVVVARGEQHLVVLQLQATSAASLDMPLAWQQVIESFRLLEPIPETPLFEPLPAALEDISDVH